jgi:C1A family cysteine protease
MKAKLFALAIVFIMIISCFLAVDTTSVEIKDNICSCTKTVKNSQETYDSSITKEEIARLQNEISKNGWSFTVGENGATQRSIDELCGLVEPDNWGNEDNSDIFVTTTLPDSFDWNDASKNYIGRKCTTDIKDQGNCGSCWAFGTVGPLESAILIKEAVAEDLSEQWLLSCNTGGYGCYGGWWAHSWHAGTTGKCGGTGAVYEKDFEYVAREVACSGPYAHIFLVDDWSYIGSKNSVPSVDAIKQVIYDHGPVSAAVYVNSAFQAYNSGIFDSDGSGSINHAVVLVGWNDDSSVKNGGYWILRNSWGSDWGENGYMRIAYQTHSIGYAACYIHGYERLVEGDETVNLYVKKITNEGSDFEPIDLWPSEEPEWYYKVQIGPEYTETNENLKEGADGFWPWDWKSEFTWNVEQGHVAYVNSPSVDIKIEVWDNDLSETDDQADITPKSGRTLTGKYNLVSDKLVYSDETDVPIDSGYYKIKGTQDDNAEITFKVTDSYNSENYEPQIKVDPTKIDLGTVKEGTHTGTFKVSNTAPDDKLGWATKLDWTAKDDQDWITLSKTSGSLSGGGSDTVTATANANDLSKGTHTGTITVESNAGTKKVTVEIVKKDKAKTKTDILLNNPLYLLKQFFS